MATEYELVLSVRLLRRVLELADADDNVFRFVSTPADNRLVVDGTTGYGSPWQEIVRVEDQRFVPANEQPEEETVVVPKGAYL